MAELRDRLSFGDIDNLPRNEKGTFGEALAGTYFKSKIRQDPTIIAGDVISKPDPTVWISHISGPTQIQRLCFERSSGDVVSWEPDFSFEFSLPEYDLSWRILFEAKVSSSRPKGNQLAAMELAADQETPITTTGLEQPTTPDKRLVYFCQIQLDEDSISLTYERI